MRPDDFERDLARRLGDIQVPEDLEDRLVAASRSWLPAAPRRRPKRRRLVLMIAAGLALGGGAAGAVTLLDPLGGVSVPASEPALRAIEHSELLSRAPWLRQPAGAPLLDEAPRLPALLFPPGTEYQEALQALFSAVVEKGSLPPGTELAEPLPRGVVWAPGEAGEPAALDLRAPWGFTLPEGRIRTPSYVIPGGLAPREASAVIQALEGGHPLRAALPQGVRVSAPPLEPCQIGTGQRPKCRLR